MAALIAPPCGWCGRAATLDVHRTRRGPIPLWVCIEPPCNRVVKPVGSGQIGQFRDLYPHLLVDPAPKEEPKPTTLEEINEFARVIADDIIQKGFKSIEGNLFSFHMHWHSRRHREAQPERGG